MCSASLWPESESAAHLTGVLFDGVEVSPTPSHAPHHAHPAQQSQIVCSPRQTPAPAPSRNRVEQYSRVLEHHSRFIEQYSRFIEQYSSFLEHHSSFLEHDSRILEQHSRLLEQHSRLLEQYSDLLEQQRRLLKHGSFLLHDAIFLLELDFHRPFWFTSLPHHESRIRNRAANPLR